MVDGPPAGYVDCADEYHDRIVVASMDILGMANRVESDEDATTAAADLDIFLKNAQAPYHYRYDKPSVDSPVGRLYSRALHFGDSIYLFGDPEKSLSEQATLLLGKSAVLIALGVKSWIEKRDKYFLLRVGIAVGNIRWRSFRWFDDVIEFPIGTALTRAHRIQEAQEWIGGAIDRQLHSSYDHYRLEFAVPLKTAGESEVDAVNWVQAVADNQWLDFFLDAYPTRVESIQAETADVLRKHANTQRFLDHAARCIAPPPA